MLVFMLDISFGTALWGSYLELIWGTRVFNCKLKVCNCKRKRFGKRLVSLRNHMRTGIACRSRGKMIKKLEADIAVEGEEINKSLDDFLHKNINHNVGASAPYVKVPPMYPWTPTRVRPRYLMESRIIKTMMQ